MVLSALLGFSSDRNSTRPAAARNRKKKGSISKSATSSPQPLKSPGSSSHSLVADSTPPGPEYISDETHLQPLDPETPDLRELNNCLEALVAVFPDVQIDVFREMISSFDGESRLALVADALLKNKATWVKGRWRIVDGGGAAAAPRPAPSKRATSRRQATAGVGETSLLQDNEVFRSPAYQKAAKLLAWHEFKGLSRPTITAVLAEYNYSYLDARPTLVGLSSRSWSYTISSLFLRRKPVTSTEAEDHPLVVWKSSGRGSIIPCLKSTGNAELDRELFDCLIAPLRERSRDAQVEKDRTLAISLNTAEAEESDGTHDCACCFTSATFEELTSCNAEGHLVCFRCVQHSISEAVFGQGWRRNIDPESGTLVCPAVDSDECKGRIPADHIQRAMMEEKRGAEIMHKFDQRLAEHSLVASDMPLVRCPFCSYAEVDDIYLPVHESDLSIRTDSFYGIAFLVLCLTLFPFVLLTLLISTLGASILGSGYSIRDYLSTQFNAALVRHRRRRRGLKFTCLAPGCRRTSCLSCNKEWVDVHVCHESSLVALRTQVEQAMSMAIKRVCPRCNTSFVKTAGCNKLTCPCGYKMCYVCRKDIGGTDDPDGPDVGYRHFCDHFRPEGDGRQCKQCDRCNLWQSEDTDKVLEGARREAERRWRETEDRDLSAAEKAFLETGVAAGSRRRGSPRSIESLLFSGRWPALPEVFDVLVENFFT